MERQTHTQSGSWGRHEHPSPAPGTGGRRQHLTQTPPEHLSWTGLEPRSLRHRGSDPASAVPLCQHQAKIPRSWRTH